MEIRELKETDYRLMENFWIGLSPDTFIWWSHYKNVDDIFQEKSHKLIGLKSGKIVVYGFLLPNDTFPDTPSLGLVTLNSERRKGFGEEMMRNLEKVGKVFGYKKLFLTTYIDNTPSFLLYKKMGYEIQGLVKRNGKDSYAMIKNI